MAIESAPRRVCRRCGGDFSPDPIIAILFTGPQITGAYALAIQSDGAPLTGCVRCLQPHEIVKFFLPALAKVNPTLQWTHAQVVWGSGRKSALISGVSLSPQRN